jgi:hypothetical protein
MKVMRTGPALFHLCVGLSQAVPEYAIRKEFPLYRPHVPRKAANGRDVDRNISVSIDAHVHIAFASTM